MFIGALVKGKNLNGYLTNELVEFRNIFKRHDELAQEMVRRGMKHNSPLHNEFFYFYSIEKINVEASIEELKRRCSKCKERIKNANVHYPDKK